MPDSPKFASDLGNLARLAQSDGRFEIFKIRVSRDLGIEARRKSGRAARDGMRNQQNCESGDKDGFVQGGPRPVYI